MKLVELYKTSKQYHERFFEFPMVGAALIRRHSKLDWKICIEIAELIAKFREDAGIEKPEISMYGPRPLTRHEKETDAQKEKRKRHYALHYKRWKHLISELTDKEKVQIQDFYVNCPPGYQVDHVIPLTKGGIHHISNFQYLTASDNARKNART